MASTSTQDLTDVALEAPPTTTSNIASLEANVAPTLSGPESKQSTSDTSSTSTNSIATLVDPVTGAIVEPAELEGMEGWIRYEETNDYKLHSTWETAKTRGFKGKCKWAAYKMADGKSYLPIIVSFTMIPLSLSPSLSPSYLCPTPSIYIPL